MRTGLKSGGVSNGPSRARLSVLAAGALFWLPSIAQAAGWQFEPIEYIDLDGQFSSMQIDKLGNAHVAYVIDDHNVYPLQYAFRDHALKKWYVMNVDKGASFCALTLDSKGRPHISYADHGTAIGSKLRFAFWNGNSWTKQVVPVNSEVVGYYTSIALDSEDHPSITYYEYRGAPGTEMKNRLRNARWSGQFWAVQTVDGENGSGKFNAMASDPKGQVQIAYGNVVAAPSLRYAFWDGKAWKVDILETVQETGGYVGNSVAIAVDRDGDPHISYTDTTNRYIKYAVRKNKKWQFERVDAIVAAAYPDRNSIVIDDSGRPILAYYDRGLGILKIAVREGRQWFTTVVDRNAAGFTSSMQIVGDELWITYTDEGKHGLKFGRIDLKELSGTSVTNPASNTNGPEIPKTAGERGRF